MAEKPRNALTDFLVSEKDQRPYWETDHRGMMLPLVKSGYNNSVSYGVPGVLGGQGWQTMNDIVSGRSVTPDEIGHAAGDVAGAAMTGSFVGAIPRVATGASEASPSGNRFYRGSAGEGQPSRGDVMWGSTSDDVAGRYAAASKGAVRDLEYRFENPYVHDVGGAQWNNLPYPQDMLRLSSGDWLQPENIAKHAQAKGHDGLILKNINDDPALGNAPIADTVAALRRGTVYDGDGNLFFSNPKQSSAAASIDHMGKTATRSLDMNWLNDPSLAEIASNYRLQRDGIFAEPIGSGGRTQQPVRAYHGTGTAFDKFKPNGIGPHFGDVGQAESRLNAKNQRYASEGGADPSGYLDGSNIIPVDLNLSRVVDLPDMNAWGARQVADAISNAAPDLAGLSADVARILRDGLKRKAHQFVERDANDHIRKTLINNGYDGIKYSNKFEGNGDSYIAVAPGTVRSATTGDILYSNPKQSSAAASIDHMRKSRGHLSSPEEERQALANYLLGM